MAHDDLLQAIRMMGCHWRRCSEKHDIYVNPSTGRKVSIPRQREIADELAALIKNRLGGATEG